MQTFQFGFLVLVLAFFSACKGQTKSNNFQETSNSDSKIAQQIDSLISIYNYNEGFIGSVLVAQKGKVIFKKGYGEANKEWDIPNETNTKFRIASVTKPFTALLILQLVADHKLDLNQSITTYLKDYPKETGDRIKIHHLLTHSSGLVRNIETDDKMFHKPKQLVDIFKNEPLLFIPGEKFQYSNAGYVLLGYLIEQITGKSYNEVLEEKILKPLKMYNTGYYRHRKLLPNRSAGYRNNFIDYNNANYFDYSNAFSSGAIYSTVEDMLLFDQALYSEKLLPKKYLDLAFTKQIEDKDYGGYYGYGWEIMEKPVGNSGEVIETIGHTGALPDYCAIFTRIPSSETTIVVLSNKGRSFLNAITNNTIALLMNKSLEWPKKSAAKALYESIKFKGMEEGEQRFGQVKNDENYYVSENEMNILSYIFMENGDFKTAKHILEIAIDYFPNAFNLYDSYGEVLLNMGEKEEAIKNYKKSVELNPDNQHGVEVLKQLQKE